MESFESLMETEWIYWFFAISLLIFILWLFVGGGDYEYIGLSPLKIGVDSTKHIDDQTHRIIKRDNY